MVWMRTRKGIATFSILPLLVCAGDLAPSPSRIIAVTRHATSIACLDVCIPHGAASYIQNRFSLPLSLSQKDRENEREGQKEREREREREKVRERESESERERERERESVCVCVRASFASALLLQDLFSPLNLSLFRTLLLVVFFNRLISM